MSKKLPATLSTLRTEFATFFDRVMVLYNLSFTKEEKDHRVEDVKRFADGRIGLFVEEKNRSWCSSSNANDQRAITIECASDKTEPYAFYDVVYNRLIELCIDICKRNGKKKLLWLEDKDKTLAYNPKHDEMVLTVHRWFANKSCPGAWMYARMGDLAKKVTAALGGTTDTPTTDPVKPTTHPDKLTDGWRWSITSPSTARTPSG